MGTIPYLYIMGLLDALSAPITGIINGVSSAIQGKQNRKAQLELAQKQYEYSTQLQAQQNEFNIDQWNRNNEYNTPEAIRQRYEQAGLNPATMMTGQSYNSSPVEASQDEFQMPGNPNYYNFQNLGTDTLQSFIGIKNLISDMQLKSAEAEKAKAEAEKSRKDTEYQDILNKWADSSEEQRVELLKQQIQSLKSSQNLSDTEVKKLEAEIPWISKLSEAQFQNVRASSQKLMLEVATEIQKRKNLKVEVSQMLANIAYLKALKDKTYEEADKAHYEQQIGEVEAALKRTYGFKMSAAELKRMESESYGLFMDNMSKYIDNLNKINGIDTKSNPVNNALRMIQMILHPGTSPGSASPGVPIPMPYDPTSKLDQKIETAVDRFLASSFSGRHSHITHKNPTYVNTLG